MLHATYQRLYTQPIDDYTYLLDDKDFIARASPELLGLLGPFTTISACGTAFAANIYDAGGSYESAFQLFLIGMLPAGFIMMWLGKPGAARPLTHKRRQTVDVYFFASHIGVLF